jgi:hypothetical protein
MRPAVVAVVAASRALLPRKLRWMRRQKMREYER